MKTFYNLFFAVILTLVVVWLYSGFKNMEATKLKEIEEQKTEIVDKISEDGGIFSKEINSEQDITNKESSNNSI